MRRMAILSAIVAGANAAVATHTPGATLKTWGASGSIDVPGYRYLSYSPPWSGSTETMDVTISGWLRGAVLAETVAAAIVDELHADTWRTYRGEYCRITLAGLRMNQDEEPGVYRFDLDFTTEAARDVAYRH